MAMALPPPGPPGGDGDDSGQDQRSPERDLGDPVQKEEEEEQEKVTPWCGGQKGKAGAQNKRAQKERA